MGCSKREPLPKKSMEKTEAGASMQSMPAAKTGLDPIRYQQAMAQLMQNNSRWHTLERVDKVRVVEAIIEMFKERENAAILNSAESYVDRADQMLRNPSVQANMPTVIKILAVMEYDYFNGQDKDQLAMQILGQRMYEQNRARRDALQAKTAEA